VLSNFIALPLQAQLLARAIFRAAQNDWTDLSMSSEVVAHEQTLTRMTERPCQVEAPHQQSPMS
jgi:FixJ family two-component response regulator